MYAHLEEEHGLAKRAMAIYDRATRVVSDTDKFEMFAIYIAQAASSYGLPATRPIYERALETLPDKPASKMALRFAALERKLGEVDRARAIYAHASQLCDPRTSAEFWKEWHAFEIDAGSEDTFREMLRVKRSVQARFNTEASYLVATAASNVPASAEGEKDGDPMAVAERSAGGGAKNPAFVAASTNPVKEGAPVETANAEEIQISDEE